LPAQPASGACVTPALAWIDAPQPGGTLPTRFEVRGWAFKEGAGLSRVDVTLDGAVVAEATYGSKFDVGEFFPGSTDPNLPHIGFQARIDLPDSQAGRRWLGLRLHGSDGSVEEWPQQPVRIVSGASDR
jgi:hypothetical protein